jgi:hypothetical protein
VTSVLNSVLLDQIGAASLMVQPSGAPVPYVAKDLHVDLTLSNLRGIPYAIQFEGGGFGIQPDLYARLAQAIRYLAVADHPFHRRFDCRAGRQLTGQCALGTTTYGF